MSLATLLGMENVPDSTESLLDRTKKLLTQRGDLTLREIADGAGVGHEWLRSFMYGDRIREPGVLKIQKIHDFLADYQAAQRFKHRDEARAN